jgi:multidrug efflux pump subunit AcrA (membrane-fusion protein)
MAAVITLTGCNKEKKAEANAAAATPAETVYAVNTAMAKLGSLDDYLVFGGNVMAASTVSVLPTASGKIARLNVNVGDRVGFEQILMRVDPSQPGLNYELSPVRAPIAGTITSLPYTIGTTVGPGTPVATIASTNRIEIEIAVAERFVSRVKMGESASLSFDAYPGETFDARVTEVSPVLDSTSRTMTVKLTPISNPQNKIKIGMFARVKMITNEMNTIIVIPSNAVVVRNAKSYIFTVNKGTNTVTMAEIVPGTKVDDLMEVQSGLVAGEEIVTRGQALLSDGSKINILSSGNSADGTAETNSESAE